MNPANSRGSRWLVVGGGVMGLRVAQELVDRGQSVKVVEAAPSLGGLTSPWRLGDVRWDRFYHVTLLSDDVLRAQLSRLGLEDDLRWTETRTGFYAGGQLHSMSDTWEFLKFPPLSLVQRLRLGFTIFLASRIRDWRRMETQSVESWLRRWSGNAVFEKIWLPLLKAKLGDAYRQTSAAFIWAHTARMYKARRSGAKKEMFGYVPGGYARVLDRWHQHLVDQGVIFQTDSPVRSISRDPHDGRLTVRFARHETEAFDAVVSTIASPLIADMVPQLPESEKTAHRGIRYLGVICGSMLMKGSISPYYVTNITDPGIPLTGVIEMSTVIDRQAELNGHHLVYLPQYATDDDDLLNQPDEEFRQRCLQTLETMYEHFSPQDVIAFEVARARYVAALSTIDYSQRLPPVVSGVTGFYALNSAHILEGNLNVNETIKLARDKFAAEVWPDFTSQAGHRFHDA